MSIGSDTVMTVAPDSHRIPYYLPGKKPFVPYFRYSVKDKYSIKGEEMQGGNDIILFCIKMARYAVVCLHLKYYYDIIKITIIVMQLKIAYRGQKHKYLSGQGGKLCSKKS